MVLHPNVTQAKEGGEGKNTFGEGKYGVHDTLFQKQ